MKKDRVSRVSCETLQSEGRGHSVDVKLPKPIDLYDVARFFSNVVVKNPTECWFFHGTILNGRGYGQFVAINERWLAHRFSYLIFNQELPPDLVVRHKCDNRNCVNPYHLETGTIADNNKDRDIRQRTAKGSKNGRSKLTEEEVLSILHSSDTYVELALRYGIDKSTVGRIKNGGGWNHITKLRRKPEY